MYLTQATHTVVSCSSDSIGKTALPVVADNSLLSGWSASKPEICEDVVGAASCPSGVNGSLITYIKLPTKTCFLKFETL